MGEKNSEVLKQVLEENLENAITFEKSESGYHQNPIDRDLGWTDSQVEKFKVKECDAVLTSLGFPCNGLLLEKQTKLKLLNRTAHENKRQCEAMYGHSDFTRGSGAADCSWLTRTFGKNAKSNCGQVTVIHQGTGLPLAHTTRVITCSTCERAKTKGTEPVEHECRVNHEGKSIKSMEPEMICELTASLRDRRLVIAQLALDGDATPINHLQNKLVFDPAFRFMGEKQIVAMKSDDNHRNKTTKNAIHKFNTELIETIGNRKHPPLDVNKDAAHLGRISNLVRIQHISWYFPSPQERQTSFCKSMQNISAHYFNDDPGVHATCELLCPKNCCVVKARRSNAVFEVIHLLTRSRMWWHKIAPSNCGTKSTQKAFLGKIAIAIYKFAFFIEPPLIQAQTQQLFDLETKAFDDQTGVPNCLIAVDPKAVKPKQTGGKWLGERCVTNNQVKRLRQKFDELWGLYSQPHVAEMILRGGDTNKNESLHSGQFRMCRKDLNFGDASAYTHAMSCGVLKKSVGNSFLIRLAQQAGARLSTKARKFIARKDTLLTKQKTLRKLRSFKLQRKKNKTSLKTRKHAQTENNCYLGNGEALGKLNITL